MRGVSSLGSIDLMQPLRLKPPRTTPRRSRLIRKFFLAGALIRSPNGFKRHRVEIEKLFDIGKSIFPQATGKKGAAFRPNQPLPVDFRPFPILAGDAYFGFRVFL